MVGADSPSQIAFESFGVGFGFRSRTPAVLDQLATGLLPGTRSIEPCEPGRALRWYSVDEAGDHARLAVSTEESPLVTAETDEALAVLDADLRLHVASHAPEHVFIHAGVVAVGGRAVVIPGRSFTGKSTLVAALVQSGAVYYSDEYAVLDAQGRVHPFARHLSLREPQQRRGRRVDPASLAAADAAERVGVVPVPISLVVSTAYAAAASWDPEPLSPGQAALALIDNAVAAQLAPERVMPAVRAAVADARAVRSHRAEARETALAILALAAA